MMKYNLLYLVSIVAVNFTFANTDPLSTPLGMLPIGTFVVGIVFVLRDYAQRELGHKVILVMLIGCVISYFMASPFVAIASATAFVFSELLDWVVFTLLKSEFHKRVLYSSIVGVFVDTVIFLPMIGFFSVGAVLIMWLSKMVAAAGVYLYYENHARL